MCLAQPPAYSPDLQGGCAVTRPSTTGLGPKSTGRARWCTQHPTPGGPRCQPQHWSHESPTGECSVCPAEDKEQRPEPRTEAEAQARWSNAAQTRLLRHRGITMPTTPVEGLCHSPARGRLETTEDAACSPMTLSRLPRAHAVSTTATVQAHGGPEALARPISRPQHYTEGQGGKGEVWQVVEGIQAGLGQPHPPSIHGAPMGLEPPRCSCTDTAGA